MHTSVSPCTQCITNSWDSSDWSCTWVLSKCRSTARGTCADGNKCFVFPRVPNQHGQEHHSQQLEFLGFMQHDDLTAYSEAASPQEVSQITYDQGEHLSQGVLSDSGDNSGSSPSHSPGSHPLQAPRDSQDLAPQERFLIRLETLQPPKVCFCNVSGVSKIQLQIP